MRNAIDDGDETESEGVGVNADDGCDDAHVRAHAQGSSSSAKEAHAADSASPHAATNAPQNS